MFTNDYYCIAAFILDNGVIVVSDTDKNVGSHGVPSEVEGNNWNEN